MRAPRRPLDPPPLLDPFLVESASQPESDPSLDTSFSGPALLDPFFFWIRPPGSAPPLNPHFSWISSSLNPSISWIRPSPWIHPLLLQFDRRLADFQAFVKFCLQFQPQCELKRCHTILNERLLLYARLWLRKRDSNVDFESLENCILRHKEFQHDRRFVDHLS